MVIFVCCNCVTIGRDLNCSLSQLNHENPVSSEFGAFIDDRSGIPECTSTTADSEFDDCASLRMFCVRLKIAA